MELNKISSWTRKAFLAFITIVFKCTTEIDGKTDRIKMALDVARRLLIVVGISGEKLDVKLRDGFVQTQAIGFGF